jgi:hypothetical protein
LVVEQVIIKLSGFHDAPKSAMNDHCPHFRTRFLVAYYWWSKSQSPNVVMAMTPWKLQFIHIFGMIYISNVGTNC